MGRAWDDAGEYFGRGAVKMERKLVSAEGFGLAVEKLAAANRLLVLTGAGISAESGIPTFRGENGLWEGFRQEDLATPSAFARDRELVWRWYRWRRYRCLQATPNPGHHTVAELELAYPEFLLATQNVDGLHRRAGSRKLVELHGNIDRARCLDCGEVFEVPEAHVVGAEDFGEKYWHRDSEEEPNEFSEYRPPEGEDEGALSRATLAALAESSPMVPGTSSPLCQHCGGICRPHILWFGESYWPGVIKTVQSATNGAEVVLVVGTSGQVGVPVAIALHAVEQGAFLIDINPEANELSEAGLHLQGPAGEVLPTLWKHVRAARG